MFISYSEILESERLGCATTRGDQISRKICGIISSVQMIYQAQMMTIILVYHFLGLSRLWWNSLDSGRQVRKGCLCTCPWPRPVLTKVCFLKGCFDTVRPFSSTQLHTHTYIHKHTHIHTYIHTLECDLSCY